MTGTMTAEQLKPGMRLNFKNGWTIVVHRVKDGEVFYRAWLPGESEACLPSFPRSLCRMAVETFLEDMEKVRYTCE